MATTKSWDILVDPYARPKRIAPRGSQAPGPPAAGFRGARTTGFFDVPGEAGDSIDLVIFLSSFSDESLSASVRVLEKQQDEVRTVFTRVLSVPTRQARRLEVSGVGGTTLRLDVQAPGGIVPSAAVTQFFVADAGILTLLYHSPADFVQI